MTLTGIIVFVGIGAAIGYAAASINAQGKSIHHCEQCLGLGLRGAACPDQMEDPFDEADKQPSDLDKGFVGGMVWDKDRPDLPPRVVRAIREAADAIGTCDGSRVTSDEPQDTSDERRETSDDLTDGPRVWAEPTWIEQIETGHLPPAQRDVAIGAAGERGRHQITEAAWNDAMDWLKRNRGWKTRWEWKVDAHDSARSTVVASTIINDMLPRWLTCQRLFRGDETHPVPDTVDTRVAAYNCGAYQVRKAWQWSRCIAKSDWREYLPPGTQAYLIRYHAEADAVQTTRGTK